MVGCSSRWFHQSVSVGPGGYRNAPLLSELNAFPAVDANPVITV